MLRAGHMTDDARYMTHDVHVTWEHPFITAKATAMARTNMCTDTHANTPKHALCRTRTHTHTCLIRTSFMKAKAAAMHAKGGVIAVDNGLDECDRASHGAAATCTLRPAASRANEPLYDAQLMVRAPKHTQNTHTHKHTHARRTNTHTHTHTHTHAHT